MGFQSVLLRSKFKALLQRFLTCHELNLIINTHRGPKMQIAWYGIALIFTEIFWNEFPSIKLKLVGCLTNLPNDLRKRLYTSFTTCMDWMTKQIGQGYRNLWCRCCPSVTVSLDLTDHGAKQERLQALCVAPLTCRQIFLGVWRQIVSNLEGEVSVDKNSMRGSITWNHLKVFTKLWDI